MEKAVRSISWTRRDFFDFVGETLQGLAAAETALIVPQRPQRRGSRHRKRCSAMRKTNRRPFVISRLDEENADYFKALDSLTDAFGVGVCPLTVPIVSGGKLAGYYSFLSESAVDLDGKAMAAPAEMADTLEELKDKLFENIAETDEALMDKYFAGEAFTEQGGRPAWRQAWRREACSPSLPQAPWTKAAFPCCSTRSRQYFPIRAT